MILALKLFFIVSVFGLALICFDFYVKIHVTLDYFSNFLCKEYEEISSSYDYIIVGSGTAGSVITLRLSEKKENKVLLLEAGPHSNFLFNIPALTPVLQRTYIDWQYETIPQRNACLAMKNNISNWPMGKIFGGSHRINNMIHIRSNKKDYKEWFKNCSNYDYDRDIFEYYKKSENWMKTEKNSNTKINNPLNIDKIGFVSQIGDAILNAAKFLGFRTGNLNEKHGNGFMIPYVTTINNKRFTTADYLLYRNPLNLKILTHAHVSKILFKNDYEAYAVQFTYLGNKKKVRAKKGIILSAGVIGTPKILQLSGIGPKKELEKLKIRVKKNLPVGENLQDHVSTGMDLIILNQTLSVTIESLASPISMYNYFINSNGPLTTVGCEAIGFYHANYSKDLNENIRPNLQFMVLNAGISSDGGKHLKNVLGLADNIWDSYFAKQVDKQVISIIPIVLHPKSKGYVLIKNDDPNSKPLINPNYLSEPEDIKVLINGIKLVKKLVFTDAMQKLGAILNTKKFPGCENREFDSDNYWECYIRHLTLTVYHPCCTCKMGNEEDLTSVVNYNFQVIGTNKLFIADASIIPSSPSANTNSVIAVFAEKVADSIKNYEFLLRGNCRKFEIFIRPNICLLL